MFRITKGLVVIMRGLPGSGKSRYAKQLADEFNTKYRSEEQKSAVVVSADDFFTFGTGRAEVPGFEPKYEFVHAKLGQAHAACLFNFVKALLLETRLVVVDNTNTTHWESQNYEVIADRLATYSVANVAMHNTSRLTVTDLHMFCERNRHGVPFSVIADMAARWEWRGADYLAAEMSPEALLAEHFERAQR